MAGNYLGASESSSCEGCIDLSAFSGVSRIFSILLDSFNVSSRCRCFARSFQRHCMIRPRPHYPLCLLIALAVICGPGFVSLGEQPPAVPPAPAELKTAPPPRAKPQIIYRVPRASSYAATLHSQSKTQSHPLPIDSSMPPSLQMSRAAANEAAARAQQEQSAAAKNATTPRQQKVRRPKPQSSRGPSKARGPQKSGKKK